MTRDQLLKADAQEQLTMLRSYLNGVVGRVLGIGKSGLGKLDANQPITRLGIDSLMALEVKTRIDADLGAVIPIVSLLKGTSIAHLAANVADQLAIQTPAIHSLAAMSSAARGEQWEELHI